MEFVIDRVDLLAYVAGDACIRNHASGTLSVPLKNAAAFYLSKAVPRECSEPLTLAF